MFLKESETEGGTVITSHLELHLIDWGEIGMFVVPSVLIDW